MYSVVLLGFILCLWCLDGQVCVILTTSVWWVRVDVLYGQEVSIGMGSADVVEGGLVRFMRPLMVSCVGILIVGIVSFANLARSAVFLASGYVLLLGGRKEL